MCFPGLDFEKSVVGLYLSVFGFGIGMTIQYVQELGRIPYDRQPEQVQKRINRHLD